MIITILKFIGILFLVFVLWQALLNPWTPIYWYVRKWKSNIGEFFKNLIRAKESDNKDAIYKITVNDFKWENFVEADLLEFKRKYKWSKKPEWCLVTGGAAHKASDSVEGWVYSWIESHPDAEIINTCKEFRLRTRLQILLDRQDDHKVRQSQYLKKAQSILDRMETFKNKEAAKKEIERLNGMAGERAFMATNLNIEIALEKDKPTKLTQPQ